MYDSAVDWCLSTVGQLRAAQGDRPAHDAGGCQPHPQHVVEPVQPRQRCVHRREHAARLQTAPHSVSRFQSGLTASQLYMIATPLHRRSALSSQPVPGRVLGPRVFYAGLLACFTRPYGCTLWQRRCTAPQVHTRRRSRASCIRCRPCWARRLFPVLAHACHRRNSGVSLQSELRCAIHTF